MCLDNLCAVILLWKLSGQKFVKEQKWSHNYPLTTFWCPSDYTLSRLRHILMTTFGLNDCHGKRVISGNFLQPLWWNGERTMHLSIEKHVNLLGVIKNIYINVIWHHFLTPFVFSVPPGHHSLVRNEHVILLSHSQCVFKSYCCCFYDKRHEIMATKYPERNSRLHTELT